MIAVLFFVSMVGSVCLFYFVLVARHAKVRAFWRSPLVGRAARGMAAGVYDVVPHLAGGWFGADENQIPSTALPRIDHTAAVSQLGAMLQRTYEEVRGRRVKVGSLLAFCGNPQDEALAVFAGVELRETARSRGRRARKAPAVILLPSMESEEGREPEQAKLSLELMRVRLKKKARTLGQVRRSSVRWMMVRSRADLCKGVDKLKRQDAWVIACGDECEAMLRSVAARDPQGTDAVLSPLGGSAGMVAMHVATKAGFQLLKDACDMS